MCVCLWLLCVCMFVFLDRGQRWQSAQRRRVEGGLTPWVPAVVPVNPVFVCVCSYMCVSAMFACRLLLKAIKQKETERVSFRLRPPRGSSLFCWFQKTEQGRSIGWRKKKKKISPPQKSFLVFWGLLDCKPAFKRHYHWVFFLWLEQRRRERFMATAEVDFCPDTG